MHNLAYKISLIYLDFLEPDLKIGTWWTGQDENTVWVVSQLYGSGC